MKWKLYLPFLVIVPVVVLAAFISSRPAEPEFESAREMIVLRKIAHEVLRSAGDSISRIPSIQRISDTEFRIPFERRFTFEPDSLVKTIHQVMHANALGDRYIVNVLEPSTGEVVFGYAMLGAGQDDIVPCLGREQQARNYTIVITLAKGKAFPTNWMLWVTGSLVAAILFYLFWMNSRRPGAGSGNIPLVSEEVGREEPGVVEPDAAEPGVSEAGVSGPDGKGVPIGLYRFMPEERMLYFEEEKTELTAKEARLLGIFIRQLNQVIDRKQLQKEVWEDEGIIVGRSLDMFISRIRKKLDRDPALKLINIHGKGYKLELNGSL
ncbi:winged helix-turn-helix domain-containing protein [Flavihumibacter stibioxidans]|uniref:OmpR/PhoB-type domain-containing protein n=1 Tax=Flavihumibacter stibioxidans TaxID=1834163 RepID=A0ABR7M9B7_9BACT|nr:winged helix-turn-helix domain-containing protein [Flavihumibacter stibioxidans]MBC6491531.1 hypothetical protein [Flavihumibacter stibioxidans]